MSKYKEIKGFKVQTLSSDPVASGLAGASWSSGGSLNVGKYWNGRSGAGTQTAGLIAGGHNGSGQVGTTESYNGSSWTEVNDLNTARNSATMGGAQTSALITGGGTAEAITESWNGSSWTEVNDLNTGRRQLAMATGNANTSALAFGGYAPPTPGPVGYTGLTESWNGSSWTEVSDLNTPRSSLASTDGSATAALAIAGYRGPPTADRTKFVEQWDGSSWTEVGDVNQERMDLASCGTTTNALAFGGIDTASLAVTENYNGTSWTELADLSTARYALGGTGSTPAALAIGGYITTVQSVTEEWNIATDFTKQNLGQVYYNSTSNAYKVTAQPAAGGTWAAGGDLNTARSRFGGAGQATQSAALVFGAGDPPYGQTEEYNGTAWSEQNDLNTGRNISPGGAGTQTAALTAGGYNPAGSPQYNTVNSETYNGTSWTEGNDLNEGRIDCVTFGSSTAGILVGGGEASGGPGTVASVEIYNGTSWTETTDIPTVTQEMAGWGVQTSGAIVGGSVDSDPTMKNTTVEWDGTSWSAGGNYSRNNKYFQAFGTSVSSGLAAGGENPGESPARLSIAAVYDGTSWSEVAELSSARHGTAGGGTTTSGLISGGTTAPTTVASTEEWTVPEANKTITVS